VTGRPEKRRPAGHSRADQRPGRSRARSSQRELEPRVSRAVRERLDHPRCAGGSERSARKTPGHNRNAEHTMPVETESMSIVVYICP
jgi:hypothetical protein